MTWFIQPQNSLVVGRTKHKFVTLWLACKDCKHTFIWRKLVLPHWAHFLKINIGSSLFSSDHFLKTIVLYFNQLVIPTNLWEESIVQWVTFCHLHDDLSHEINIIFNPSYSSTYLLTKLHNCSILRDVSPRWITPLHNDTK